MYKKAVESQQFYWCFLQNGTFYMEKDIYFILFRQLEPSIIIIIYLYPKNLKTNGTIKIYIYEQVVE